MIASRTAGDFVAVCQRAKTALTSAIDRAAARAALNPSANRPATRRAPDSPRAVRPPARLGGLRAVASNPGNVSAATGSGSGGQSRRPDRSRLPARRPPRRAPACPPCAAVRVVGCRRRNRGRDVGRFPDNRVRRRGVRRRGVNLVVQVRCFGRAGFGLPGQPPQKSFPAIRPVLDGVQIAPQHDDVVDRQSRPVGDLAFRQDRVLRDAGRINPAITKSTAAASPCSSMYFAIRSRTPTWASRTAASINQRGNALQITFRAALDCPIWNRMSSCVPRRTARGSSNPSPAGIAGPT